MQEKKLELYQMDLGEYCWINEYIYTRCPGGWLVRRQYEDVIVFVPFNNEFQEVNGESVRIDVITEEAFYQKPNVDGKTV